MHVHISVFVYVYMVLVYTFMCECRHICVWRIMDNNRCQYSSSTFSVWQVACSPLLAGWTSGDSPISDSHLTMKVLRLQIYTTSPALSRFWGAKRSSSVLHGNNYEASFQSYLCILIE